MENSKITTRDDFARTERRVGFKVRAAMAIVRGLWEVRCELWGVIGTFRGLDGRIQDTQAIGLVR